MNDDDDNNNGVADKDDAGGFVDDELKVLFIGVDLGRTGTLTLSAPSGGSRIRLYKDQARTEPVALPVSWNLCPCEASPCPCPDYGEFPGSTNTLWVEGVSGSAEPRDVTLRGAYATDGAVCEDLVNLTVYKVASLRWETAENSGNLPIDGDTINNGGTRIFPGKLDPNDPSPATRRTVDLVATVQPASENRSVYFKVWDVDDPFDQLNAGMPNVSVIDADSAGPDNRPTQEPPVPLTGTTDAQGEARVTFTVSMQPGNNYRAGASCLDDAPAQADQPKADAVDDGFAGKPGDFTGYDVPLTWSPMLTVWRKLHVELDSMAAVTGNETSASITDIAGIGTALTEVTLTALLDDGSQDLDDTPPSNGRFENGTLIVASGAGAVTISPVTGNGNSRVVFPQASIAGLPFAGTDSDLFGNSTISGTILQVQESGNSFVWTLNVTASSETPIDWPDFVGGKLSVGGGAEVTITGVGSGLVATSGLNIPCIVRDDDNNNLLPKFPSVATMTGAYQSAYVVPVYDVGDFNLNVPFVLNVAIGAVFSAQDWDSRSLNAPDFWVAYVLGAFQFATTEDRDPNSETRTFGVTSTLGGGSHVFFEVHQTHEAIANPLAEEQTTVVHETGHAVGNIPDSGEPVTILGQPSTFTSNSLKLIRASTKPWS